MEIYAAIASIMNEVGAIGKDKQAGSGSFGYKFRGIDDVADTEIDTEVTDWMEYKGQIV